MQSKKIDVVNISFDKEEFMDEMVERQKRAKKHYNFNANEFSKSNKVDRIRDETNTVKKLFENNDDTTGRYKIMRFGKYVGEKNAPNKAIFKTREEALKIVKNEKIIHKVPNVKMYGDQITKQREYLKMLKAS